MENHPNITASGGRRRAGLATLAASLVLAVALPVASVAGVPQLVEDSSEAMRYGVSAPIGDRLDGLVNIDDVSVILALPFTINFFGEDYGFVCVSENGAMFPRKALPDGRSLGVAFDSGAGRCSNYDLPLGGLALSANAPALASLAADHWTAIAPIPNPFCCSPLIIDGSKGVGDLLGAGGFTFPAVHAGSTTIDGKDAFVVTWYRIPSQGTATEAGEGTWTHQIVIIDDGKIDGSQVGNDFTVEFNYGTILSDEKGYFASSYGVGEGRRFAIGWASHRVLTVASVDGRDVTTTAPHGLDPNATFYVAADADDNDRRVQSVNATTIRFGTGDTTFGVGDTLRISETYEFFSDTPTSDLVDGAAKALTENRRNSDVDGRYTVSMVGGITVGFGTAQQVGDMLDDPAGALTPVLTGGALPTAGAGQGVWQLEDGTSRPLTVSSPGTNQVRYTDDGIRVTFTGAPGTDASRGLVANPAGEIVCEVCVSLAAGGVIEAWMFSTPRLVAAHAVADLPCQTFTIPVVAPLDGGGPISAGAHTLQLALPTAAGMQAVNVGVTVGGLVPGSVPAGEGPTVPVGLLAFGLLAAAGAVVVARRQVVAG